MPLLEKEIEDIREVLKEAQRPLFFFDDDPDGLSSFLLLYRLVREGKGVIVKSSPELKEEYLKSYEGYGPDVVVILDKPMVSQEFLDGVSCPVIWIDHHEPQDRKKVKYYNPRKHDDKDNRPTSYWCWQIAKEDSPEDIWIAMAGCVGDWFLPEFTPAFIAKYPQLLSPDVKRVEDALFGSKIGQLSRVFSFLLKGKTSEAMKCVKIMTRVECPEEILDQATAQGAFVWKRFKKTHEEYSGLLNAACKNASDDLFLVFTYSEKQTSFTSDLSNELLYRFPEKVILICRSKSGEMKCSLRSAKHSLPKRIERALNGLQGYGGGHEHACGVCVREDQFPEFLETLKESFK